MQKRIHTLCFLLIGAAAFAQVKIEEPLFKILKPAESKIAIPPIVGVPCLLIC